MTATGVECAWLDVDGAAVGGGAVAAAFSVTVGYDGSARLTEK
jgi:hypothetical protein